MVCGARKEGGARVAMLRREREDNISLEIKISLLSLFPGKIVFRISLYYLDYFVKILCDLWVEKSRLVRKE
jgi:hypothetical protein